MLAIPVVDVRSGRCVHTHNEASRQKVIMDDPIEVFSVLVEQGAKQVQVVDVDAIRNRQPEHLSLVTRLKREFPQLALQISGGVSSSEDIQIWLDAGADWVTVGGRLLRQQDELELILVELGERIIVGMDVRAQLWQNGYCPAVGMSFSEWVEALKDEGVAALMFTEIPEQGHVNGHSLMAAGQLASSIDLPVIAHGGVHSRNDLLSLSGPSFKHLYGVTVGKPMFEGSFSFGEVVSALAH
ncbi:HisA/HisF-related TIM barrel protein [Pleionea litopenaei]|uniref:HisA/HisF-related TIM barrel protein n=1 Tax=Pleionea litopenaei TaxID=3070815 RepID=A0AA51RQT0_9GAMM|nr:HisA/HisF-related TIM barrel protein [Pleionea sp. HL-JVS1]WMS85932.1 HisA/HisF-related TIM barrel protein [Pleionea sp. HL-JVS1]